MRDALQATVRLPGLYGLWWTARTLRARGRGLWLAPRRWSSVRQCLGLRMRRQFPPPQPAGQPTGLIALAWWGRSSSTSGVELPAGPLPPEGVPPLPYAYRGVRFPPPYQEAHRTSVERHGFSRSHDRPALMRRTMVWFASRRRPMASARDPTVRCATDGLRMPFIRPMYLLHIERHTKLIQPHQHGRHMSNCPSRSGDTASARRTSRSPYGAPYSGRRTLPRLVCHRRVHSCSPCDTLWRRT